MLKASAKKVLVYKLKISNYELEHKNSAKKRLHFFTRITNLFLIK